MMVAGEGRKELSLLGPQELYGVQLDLVRGVLSITANICLRSTNVNKASTYRLLHR